VLKRYLIRVLFLCLSCASVADAAPQITLIIDDLGNALEPGRQILELPGPIVAAVLPQTPYGAQLARLAHAADKEVLLHLPLQAVDPALDDEPGGLVLDMTERRLGAALARSLEGVPFVMGVNGHRGSLLTRHPGHMRWLLRELERLDLVFVDSYTTHHSVALRVAEEVGVPATRRDVFLDNDPRPAAIEREFERLLDTARRQGSAVAIGHPYPTTVAFLRTALPRLKQRGVQLVGLRELLRGPRPDRSQPTVPWRGSAAGADEHTTSSAAVH